jgi:hypothetical protein
VRLDLVAHCLQPDGSVVAVAFRPESLAEGPCALNWSDLESSKRISLVLLESAIGGILPRVYSGGDERLYDYKWSRKKTSLPNEAAELLAQRDAFGRGDLTAEPTKFGCDRCRARAGCPHWLGAFEKS